MLDFDCIDDWAGQLTTALEDNLPDGVDSALMGAAPEFIEDARDLLFNLTDRDAIIDAMLTWMRSTQVIGYHGTRLTDAEVESVREHGLLPLSASARRVRLSRALSTHPRWNEVADGLDAVIHTHGPGASVGLRENQVHLTLSRAGLTQGFNHYLTHGAEFDQRVAHALLGTEGTEQLRRDGRPRLIHVAVPGNDALEAAHPFSDIETLRARGDLPNLIDYFLMAWSYRLAYPDFQARTLKVDSGMVFRSVVPSDWLLRIETVNDPIAPSVEATPDEASEKTGSVGPEGTATEGMSVEEIEQELAKVRAKLKEIEDERGDA